MPDEAVEGRFLSFQVFEILPAVFIRAWNDTSLMVYLMPQGHAKIIYEKSN